MQGIGRDVGGSRNDENVIFDDEHGMGGLESKRLFKAIRPIEVLSLECVCVFDVLSFDESLMFNVIWMQL